MEGLVKCLEKLREVEGFYIQQFDLSDRIRSARRLGGRIALLFAEAYAKEAPGGHDGKAGTILVKVFQGIESLRTVLNFVEDNEIFIDVDFESAQGGKFWQEFVGLFSTFLTENQGVFSTFLTEKLMLYAHF